MNTLTRSVALLVALSALSANALRAQDATGTWQGTLQAGKELRIVVIISNADGGGFKGMMYSIDQGGQGMSVNQLSIQGASVRMSIGAVGGAYEGKLSADGTSIAGTWSQGGASLPLTLRRATSESAWTIPAPPKPMAADAPAVFEVATVKPSNPDVPGKLFTVKGRQFMTVNTTLNDLISFAYGLQARQIVGGPAWMDNEKYDITGQPEGQGQPNERQLKAMVQKLVADRFKMTHHRESDELPVYAIVVGAGGHKLTRNDSNPNGLPRLFFKGLGNLPALNATIGDLASVLQTAVLDRPVVDKTGITGRYDFTLTWTPDDSQFRGLGVRIPAPSTDPNAPPGLFTALQEQLGLKLESTNAPVEVLVIDRVEKPTEN